MIQRFNNELFSGILIASQPQSGSTYTANKLSQIENIRIEHITRNIDPYGVLEQDLDIKKLEAALAQNNNSSFVAKEHVGCSNLILKLLKRNFLVPLVLTRNLPDALASLVDQYSLPNSKKEAALFPKALDSYDIERKCDYFIYFHMHWYLRFFISWIRYDEFPNVWLRFEDFKENNQAYFDQITSKLGIERINVEASESKDILPNDIISKIRVDRGIKGRGRKILNARQIELIKKMIELAGVPYEYRNYLLTGNV